MKAHDFSRRERQIMDILIEYGEQSAQDVKEKLPDPPSYSAVRALIARLVDKGAVQFRKDGAKYIYTCVQQSDKVKESAVKRLIKTFFKGSHIEAVTALLNDDSHMLTEQEINELERTIQRLKNNR